MEIESEETMENEEKEYQKKYVKCEGRRKLTVEKRV